MLGRPASPDEFYKLVAERFAPQAEAVRAQAARIGTKYPRLKSTAIAQADEALQGMLMLPGTGGKPHFVGNPPRWFDNPFQDNEYVWSLNRMPHWTPLLRAFSLTGDARYAQKVVDELRDWLKCCPRPSIDSAKRIEGEDPGRLFSGFNGVDPWRILEVGIRMFTSWPLILPHLLGTPFLTPDLLTEYASSVFEHAEALYRVSPRFWPDAAHNHYLMENLGLLAVSSLFPEFAAAERWRAHAVRELERCAAAQITEEGGQIEGCPHYHNGCINWLARALSIARAQGVSFSPEFVSKMERAIDYSLHSLRPSGAAVPWGDSDADTAIAIQSALSGFRLFQNPDYLRIAVRCCGAEEVKACGIASAWENFDTDDLLAAIDEAAASPDSISLPLDSWQKTLKQVMLRTDWSHDALSLFFACRTPVDNGHAHIDPMSFDFTAYGRALIVDPGRFCYREDADRREFKSAPYHNTLTINGRDPFEYLSSWSFGPQKTGQIVDFRQQPGCKAAIARHDNYEPAIHHRAVALIDGAALLVVDLIENLKPGDLLQLYFHVDSVRVEWDAKTGCAVTRDEGKTNVVILSGADLNGELLPGRISDFIDISRPSTRLGLTASCSEKTSRAFATVIVPWPASSSRPTVGAPQIIVRPEGLRCEFQLDGQTRSFDWPLSPGLRAGLPA
jgi:hypothetical protein